MELTWNAGGNKLNYTYENLRTAPSVTSFQDQAGTVIRRNTFSVGVLEGLDAFVKIKEAEVAKLDQVIELENAEKEVIHDVKQAYFDYQKAMIQLQSTSKRADYRKRLTRLARHRLSKNEIEVSEYLEAEIDYLREKTELYRAIKDYLTAKAELNRAVGVREFLPIEGEDE
jgi:outer membrane protein TolC